MVDKMWAVSNERYVVITPDGEMTVETLSGDPDVDAHALHDHVGGWLEAVRTVGIEGAVMWVNEEGKLNGLPPNPLATRLAFGPYDTRDWVVGTAVITGHNETTGELAGLDAEQLAAALGVTHDLA